MDIQKLLQYCVTKLVDSPELVVISEIKTAEKSIYEVKVAPTDLARIIGKEGRTFKALRSLINIPNPNTYHELVVDSIS